MDLLAGLLELLSIWLVGNKNKIAFITYNIANCFWIWTAFDKKVYGLLLVVIPAIFINIRNYRKWSKE
jgi:nicotinamide riboside transporter PnuC